MGRFVKGDVVVVPFPYSDLTTSKKRPALVVASLSGDDVILCQITSHHRMDDYSISLQLADFSSGTLKQESYIRPNHLFTADTRIVLYKAGNLKSIKLNEVIEKIISIVRS
jgi:mRNA interferase MazF